MKKINDHMKGIYKTAPVVNTNIVDEIKISDFVNCKMYN